MIPDDLSGMPCTNVLRPLDDLDESHLGRTLASAANDIVGAIKESFGFSAAVLLLSPPCGCGECDYDQPLSGLAVPDPGFSDITVVADSLIKLGQLLRDQAGPINESHEKTRLQ